MKTAKGQKSIDHDLQLPPQNLEAEQGMLGAVLLDQRTLATVLEIIAVDDLYDSRNRTVLRAMVALDDRDVAIDTITLTRQLETDSNLEAAGGMAYLGELVASVASASNVVHHARLVRDESQRRALIHAGHDLVEKGRDRTFSVDVTVSDAERIVFSLSTGSSVSGLKPSSVLVPQTLERLDAAALREGDLTGISTGYRELDQWTAGWQGGDLIVFAARPSMGKTSLALGCTLAALNRGLAVSVFSLEMPTEHLIQRLLSALTGINLQSLRKAHLTNLGRRRIEQAGDWLRSVPLSINDNSNLTLVQLRGEARRTKMKGGLDLLIVDYIQLLRAPEGSDASRQEFVAEMSRGLKCLARELNIPIIALSQLSRECEKREDRRPRLSDLRESGAIEQDSDIVMFLYREQAYNPETTLGGRTELLIRKHRNGPTCDVDVLFQESTASFSDLPSNAAVPSKPADVMEVDLEN